MTPDEIRDYCSYMKNMRNLSDMTVKSYGKDLRSFYHYLNENKIHEELVDMHVIRSFVAWKTRAGHSKASINRFLSAIRGFYHYRLSQEEIDGGNPAKMIDSLKMERRLPPFLFESEMERILNFPGPDFSDVRDRAILELLYATGCRVSELTSLKRMQFDRRIDVLRIIGKGGKMRNLFLGKESQKKVREYIPYRDERVKKYGREPETEAFFINAKGTSLTDRGVRYIIRKRSQEVGLLKNFGPHAFRHSFATHLLNRGADIRVVQELLGHSKLSTTQVYTHMGLDRLKDIYTYAHPHGRSKKRGCLHSS